MWDPATEQRDRKRDLSTAAIAFLREAATASAGDLAAALAVAVLSAALDLPSEWVRLALDVRDGVATWGAQAVTLAGLILDAQIAAVDEGAEGHRHR